MKILKRIKKLKLGKKTTWLLLFVIFALGFGVRLYKINSPIADWHSWRQVDTAAVARIYVDNGIDLLHPKYYDISSVQTGYFNRQGYRFVEFPLYNVTHALAYELLPVISFDAWGRLISIICGLITAFLLYLLGKEYINKVGGLMAAFFYLFLPFNVYFTRVILPEPMATMFAVMFIWFFVVFIKSKKYRYLYLSALAFAASILIKPYAGFYFIPVIYLAIKDIGIKKMLSSIPFYLALAIALAPLFAWRAWMGQVELLIGIPHFKWAFNGDGIRFRPAFWRWIFGERLGSLILGMWGLIPFGFGLVAPSTNSKKSVNRPVILLMLAGMLAYVVVVATASVRHDYYQTIAIPAIALMLAKGSSYMLQKLNTALLLVFCVGMMFGMSAYVVKEFYKVNHPEFVTVGDIVDKTIPKDSQIIAPDNGNTVFLYYTRRQGWPVLEEAIDRVINHKGADYYVSVNKNDADTSRFRTMFETVSEGSNYILLDLHKPINK